MKEKKPLIFRGQKLKVMADMITDRIDHWRKLPGAIAISVRFAQQFQSQNTQEQHLANQVKKLESYQNQLDTLQKVQDFKKSVSPLLEQARAFRRDKGSLNFCLHGTIEQHLGLASVGLDDLEKPLETIQPILDKKQKHGLEQTLKKAHQGQITIAELQQLSDQLNQVDAQLPLPPKKEETPAKSWPGATRHFQVMVVEDEETWRNFVTGAVKAIQEKWEGMFRIETTYFDNAQDALAAMKPKALNQNMNNCLP